jgi:pectate lyase
MDISIGLNSFLLIVIIFSSAVNAEPAAFPGALGFGSHATGGRNGPVYHVTNLDDNGKGSFRDAVSTSNRIVVFDTSGYIRLKTAVLVKSNITIAGQTAPGGGIGFRGGEISFANGSNIICRYIRVRPGSETESEKDDALSLYRAKNIIVDHCSFEYGHWNNIDGVSDDWQSSPVTDITFQNCIIANPTGQQFGAHCESVSSQWAWFYCIFANSHNRNPLAKVNDLFINNVLYNYSAGYTTHTSTPFKHDIINNYFIFGPASTGTDNTWFQIDKNQSIYCSGNIKDKNLDGILNGDTTTPYWYQDVGTVHPAPWSPLSSDIPLYSSQNAYYITTSFAGTLPRDQSDSLIVNQIKTLGKGTAGLTVGTTGPNSALYTTQSQTGLENNGYGIIRNGSREPDTDNDGMPDFWEKCCGTDSNHDDAMKIRTDGYSNIEYYINWLADFHAKTTSNKDLITDLLHYVSGFSVANPVLKINDAVNGNASIEKDGLTLKFIPSNNFTGLASVSFSLSGANNASFIGKITIAVVPSDVLVKNKQNVLHYSDLDCNSYFKISGHGKFAFIGKERPTITCYDLTGRYMKVEKGISIVRNQNSTFSFNRSGILITKIVEKNRSTFKRVLITK